MDLSRLEDINQAKKGEKSMSKGMEVWNSMGTHVCCTRGQGGKRRQRALNVKLNILNFIICFGKPLEGFRAREITHIFHFRKISLKL